MENNRGEFLQVLHVDIIFHLTFINIRSFSFDQVIVLAAVHYKFLVDQRKYFAPDIVLNFKQFLLGPLNFIELGNGGIMAFEVIGNNFKQGCFFNFSKAVHEIGNVLQFRRVRIVANAREVLVAGFFSEVHRSTGKQ